MNYLLGKEESRIKIETPGMKTIVIYGHSIVATALRWDGSANSSVLVHNMAPSDHIEKLCSGFVECFECAAESRVKSKEIKLEFAKHVAAMLQKSLDEWKERIVASEPCPGRVIEENKTGQADLNGLL